MPPATCATRSDQAQPPRGHSARSHKPHAPLAEIVTKPGWITSIHSQCDDFVRGNEESQIVMPDRKVFLRAKNGLPSLESLFAWQSQFERITRWHGRLRRQPGLDMLLTVF
jgi:hypothetical protein